MGQEKMRSLILGIVIGFFCISLMGFSLYGTGSNPAVAVSADGKYVYIVDSKKLFRSEDFGVNFEEVESKVLK